MLKLPLSVWPLEAPLVDRSVFDVHTSGCIACLTSFPLQVAYDLSNLNTVFTLLHTMAIDDDVQDAEAADTMTEVSEDANDKNKQRSQQSKAMNSMTDLVRDLIYIAS